jgi:cytochrome-b5 reductase
VTLLVKQYPGGRASGFLHSLVPGDSVRFLATLKGFNWTTNKFPAITLIAGGAGITPVYQLIQGILSNPEDKTRINLVFGVNTDQDVLLKRQFDDWTAQYPGRFKATFTVSKPESNSPYRKGYVDRELLESVMGRKQADDTKVFVCGPPAMEEALVGKRGKGGVLQELGYTKDMIHKF